MDAFEITATIRANGKPNQMCAFETVDSEVGSFSRWKSVGEAKEYAVWFPALGRRSAPNAMVAERIDGQTVRLLVNSRGVVFDYADSEECAIPFQAPIDGGGLGRIMP